jgi:hypothetical protein
MLKPPIALGVTALPSSTYLSLGGPFEHIFKGLAAGIIDGSLPGTSEGPAILDPG